MKVHQCINVKEFLKSLQMWSLQVWQTLNRQSYTKPSAAELGFLQLTRSDWRIVGGGAQEKINRKMDFHLLIGLRIDAVCKPHSPGSPVPIWWTVRNRMWLFPQSDTVTSWQPECWAVCRITMICWPWIHFNISCIASLNIKQLNKSAITCR